MAIHQKIFFLLLALIPTQLGFHFWPEWSLVLGRRVDHLSPTIYLTDVLILLIFATWRLPKISFRKIFPFLVFVAINIFFAASIPVAIYKWFKVLEFVGFGFYIVKTKPDISHVTYYVSLGILYSSLLAIAQFVLQRSVGFWILGERTFSIDTPGIARLGGGREFLRAYATFPHPNVLGGFVAILLPFIANGVVFFIGLVALLLTFSRSAWIAFLIGMGFAKRKFFFPLLLILFIFLFRFDAHEESVVVRNELNSAAISIWQTSPLFGVGLGNFLVELPKFLVSRDVYFLQPVHNIYLLLLSETGIIGLAFFLWLIWKVFRKKSSLSIIHYLLFTILLLGLVDHYPITLQQGQLLFVFLLATAAY